MIKIFFSREHEELEKEFNRWERENQEDIIISEKQISVGICFGESKWFPERAFALLVEYERIKFGDTNDRD